MKFSKQALTSCLCAIVVVALMAHATSAQNSPNDFVEGHNAARAAVGLGPVTWDNEVAAYAENYAYSQTGDCQTLTHSNGPYGENLYMGGAGGDWTAKSAIDLWVSENLYYNYESNTCEEGRDCLHYTQIVWADSTSIGCARAVCNNGNVFIICNYNPRGNIIGQWPYP